jgi:hypothetical protein
MAKITARWAKAEDAAKLAKLENTVKSPDTPVWSAVHFEMYMSRPWRRVFFINEGRRALAHACLLVTSHMWRIDRLAAISYVGAEDDDTDNVLLLLESLVDYANTDGKVRIELRVDEEQNQLLSDLRDMGFVAEQWANGKYTLAGCYRLCYRSSRKSVPS